MNRLIAAAATLPLTLSSAALAQPIEATYPEPTLDRWMYPFNQTPGTRPEASTFGAIGFDMFDNRDAQFITGFDTDGEFPTGLPLDNYRVLSVTLVARISQDDLFLYDPTHDPLETYFEPDDPDYTPDATPGRPIELFGLGYRHGFDVNTFEETTPYNPFGSPFGREVRVAFAAAIDGATGDATDVSNNVDFRFEVSPWAIGQTDAVSPGDPVPADTDFTFELDLTNPGALRYVREALAAGRLNLAITSLHEVDQKVLEAPVFHTRQGSGLPARLSITACAGQPADWNCDGVVDSDDLLDFLADWAAGDADFNGDGVTDSDDLLDFLAAWSGG